MDQQESAEAVIAVYHRHREGPNLSRADSHACSRPSWAAAAGNCGPRQRGAGRNLAGRRRGVHRLAGDTTHETKLNPAARCGQTGNARYGTVCRVLWEG
jgi:hypothetical protein